MEYARRKNIRLKDYDYSQPGYYFITICTHERQMLFSSCVGAHLCVRPSLQGDGNVIEKWLYELVQKYPHVEIDGYCIMPDHIHLILIMKGGSERTGGHAGPPLHEILKWYKTQTTNEYIRQVRKQTMPPFQKHVWQRGYYEHVIRNDEELDEIRQYVQNNPQKRDLGIRL